MVHVNINWIFSFILTKLFQLNIITSLPEDLRYKYIYKQVVADKILPLDHLSLYLKCIIQNSYFQNIDKIRLLQYEASLKS